MKGLLALIGFGVIVGVAYHMGAEGSDPFAGYEHLGYTAERNIRIVCSRMSGKINEPTRDCVERQAAAYETYNEMRPKFPPGSPGYRALHQCAKANNQASFFDYVGLVTCAESRLGTIHARRG